MPIYRSLATPRSIIQSPDGYGFPNHRFQDDQKISFQSDRKTLRSESPDYQASVDEDEHTFQSALAEAYDIGGRDPHVFHRVLLCADDVTERIRRVSLLARYRDIRPLDLLLPNLQTQKKKNWRSCL